jgi:hypothetical protein
LQRPLDWRYILFFLLPPGFIKNHLHPPPTWFDQNIHVLSYSEEMRDGQLVGEWIKYLASAPECECTIMIRWACFIAMGSRGNTNSGISWRRLKIEPWSLHLSTIMMMMMMKEYQNWKSNRGE